jgi:hypothetical protein
MANIRLSILIPHLPHERASEFARLMDLLLPQLTAEVEVVVNDAPRGGKSVAQKRNELLRGAEGDYICFVDDDDTVANDYVARILEASRLETDCITFNLVYLGAGSIPRLRVMQWGLSWQKLNTGRPLQVFVPGLNQQFTGDGVEYRCDWSHLCPVKRSIALQVPFEDSLHGEDLMWLSRAHHLVQSSTHIDQILYYYIRRPEHAYDL